MLNNDSEHTDAHPPRSHQRPVWIILFAAILIAWAGISHSQELVIDSQSVSQFESSGRMTEVRIGNNIFLVPMVAVPRQPSVDSQPKVAGGRPRYAAISGALANFDQDSDPDGWAIQISLFDKDDQVTIPARSSARFKLTPKLPLPDGIGWENADGHDVGWSKQLKFNEAGVATTKLILREPIHALFGKQSSAIRDPSSSNSVYRRDRVIGGPTFQHNRAVANRLRKNIGKPRWAELSVRVSVPGEGVFSATTVVALSPSTLVDTEWP